MNSGAIKGARSWSKKCLSDDGGCDPQLPGNLHKKTNLNYTNHRYMLLKRKHGCSWSSDGGLHKEDTGVMAMAWIGPFQEIHG